MFKKDLKEIDQLRHERMSEKVIKGLNSRNMEAFFVKTKEEACQKALELIDPSATISSGGSMSVSATGLYEKLQERGNQFFHAYGAKTPEEMFEMQRKSLLADVFLCSTNALTESGELVNMDGNSNRVAAIAFGPKEVIVIASMDKVCKDLDAAIHRVRHYVSPTHQANLELNGWHHGKTPCAITGTCGDCKNNACICCNLLITRYSREPNRIKVILVSEKLGL